MEERIKNVIGLAFNSDVSAMTIADCIPDKIEGWDSLAYLNLVALLEEEFNTSFDLDDIAAMAQGGETILGVVNKAAGS